MKQTLRQKAAEAVAKGAEVLDKALPGWRGRIDVDKLDASNQFNCVLGQLFGWYAEGCRKLPMMDVDIRRNCGFTGTGVGTNYSRSHRLLTKEWKKVLCGKNE